MIVSNGRVRRERPDFNVQGHGSLVMLLPGTPDAIRWCELHLPDDALTWSRAYVVEPRHISEVLRGIVDDGLLIRLGAYRWS